MDTEEKAVEKTTGDESRLSGLVRIHTPRWHSMIEQIEAKLDLSGAEGIGCVEMLRLLEQARKDFLDIYKRELLWCLNFTSHAELPAIFFSDLVDAGTQVICTFEVKDLAKPIENRYNWHGQNVSQWVYAGAIVFDKRNLRVSSHH